jgi:hypothetical protein
MNVIGFNFTKVFAEKSSEFKPASSTNMNIEFTGVKKEEINVFKDIEAINITFRFFVAYTDAKEKKPQKEQPKEGEVILEGNILLSATKEEAKDILKSWKKKELPPSFNVPLFNLILKKCSTKALQLEEELNLPSHIPLPQLRPQSSQKSSEESKS